MQKKMNRTDPAGFGGPSAYDHNSQTIDGGRAQLAPGTHMLDSNGFAASGGRNER